MPLATLIRYRSFAESVTAAIDAHDIDHRYRPHLGVVHSYDRGAALLVRRPPTRTDPARRTTVDGSSPCSESLMKTCFDYHERTK